MADASSFTIRELTGDKRSLELRGRALPYQPFSLGAKMRATFSWYPGNPTSTVQVLGNEEKPTNLKGAWKDRFIKPKDDLGNDVTPSGVALYKGVQVEDVKALCDAVEDIRMAAQEVEVTWDGFTRRGLITDFQMDWLRREDVDWQMELTWSGRGKPQVPPTLPTSPSAEDFASKLREKLTALQAAVQAPFQVVEDFTTQINVAIEEISDATIEAENAAQAVADSVLSPFEAAERTIAVADTVKNSASAIVTVIESFPASALYKGRELADVLMGETLSADDFSRGIKQVARELEFLGASEGDELRASARQEDLISSFTAQEGMDLRDVSMKFYGNADEWRRLMLYNDLFGSRLEAGQVVLVPKLQLADRGA